MIKNRQNKSHHTRHNPINNPVNNKKENVSAITELNIIQSQWDTKQGTIQITVGDVIIFPW